VAGTPQGGATSASAAPSGPDTASSWTIVSPGNAVRATIELADKGGVSGYPAGVRLYYTVEAGGPSGYATVLEASPLGIMREDQGFVDGLSLVDAGAAVLVDDSYTMITGKKSRIRSQASARALTFRSGASAELALDLRAYDDGFAFRYRFPESSPRARTVSAEATGFKLPAGSKGWMLPYDVTGMYTPAYESYWQSEIAAGTPSPTAPGWCLPALFQTPSKHWVLLGDTDVRGSYFAAHLGPSAPDNVYRIALPPVDEANSVGSSQPSSTLPWATAWRMVVAGASPGVIVESTLATDLAAPSMLADVSWIRPGRASWSWWIKDSNPSDYAANARFVDLAREMTWEYSLIDAGWHEMAGGSLRDLQAYAAARNVGLLLWYNSGGRHNAVTLAPRDRMDDPAKRRAEMQAISALGVRGFKVDFFQSDKPWMMDYYEQILRDAAEFRLLVNFHGATIPRGWQRTYPHLMTAEAVRGAEMYKYDGGYPAEQARRNTLLPFTRNAVASMDFTPVTFTPHTHPHLTTYAHELALAVVFESGIQHFADQVSAYTRLPPGTRTFLKRVPSTWDDTRYVEGIPGQWVVLARRKGSTWYVAGISGDAQARELASSLAFLDPGPYDAAIISDGTSSTTFAERSEVLAAGDVLKVSLPPRGGFVVTLTPRAGSARP
jgi:hypothetical protein